MFRRRLSFPQIMLTVLVLVLLLLTYVEISGELSVGAYAAEEMAHSRNSGQLPESTAMPQYLFPRITRKNLDMIVERARFQCETASNLAWSRDGDLLAMSCGKQLWIFDIYGIPETPPVRLDGHTDTVHTVAWSPDGTTLVSVSDDGTVRMWKVASSEGLGLRLGPIVVASSIDQNGCVLDRADAFSPHDTVFIVVENADVPQGTSLFVRLSHYGTPIEDSQELLANMDYTSSCINFLFEPVEGAAFDAGVYNAELFVNGKSAGSVGFTIR